MLFHDCSCFYQTLEVLVCGVRWTQCVVDAWKSRDREPCTISSTGQNQTLREQTKT